MFAKRYRVGVIGATGRGDYGHAIDTAFLGLERAAIVAVADSNAAGLKLAAQRLKTEAVFADYREMLERVKPDVVCVGPRWVTDRVEMLQAVANAGCHVYCEKPFVADLVSADAIRSTFETQRVRLAMAYQWRAMPPVQRAFAEIRSGKFGRLLRMRARPKDDARGGGEELLVHGTHWFDLMISLAGPPRWVSGHVRVKGREATTADRREGSEPVGPICGDSMLAVFGFDNGVLGSFDSTANIAPGSRRPSNNDLPKPVWDSVYGLTIECADAVLQLRQPGDVFLYPANGVLPDFDQLQWQKRWIEDWHFTPEHQPRPIRQEWLSIGNRTLANDLLDAIEQNRNPHSPMRHAMLITEMVQGVYASHFADGRRMPIPMAERKHPLA
ncbi:MAG: Gfo/Idh/MocA family protein [Planctomycetaceae bacterium]